MRSITMFDLSITSRKKLPTPKFKSCALAVQLAMSKFSNLNVKALVL